MLIIMQQMAVDLRIQKHKITSLENHIDNSSGNTNDLNEYEAKLDEFKSDVNIQFNTFKDGMEFDYNIFKKQIIELGRLRNMPSIIRK